MFESTFLLYYSYKEYYLASKQCQISEQHLKLSIVQKKITEKFRRQAQVEKKFVIMQIFAIFLIVSKPIQLNIFLTDFWWLMSVIYCTIVDEC